MPTAGIFNPKDSDRTTPVRPAHVLTALAARHWFSDLLKTRPKAQDLNQLIANFRIAFDNWGLVDSEANADNVLRDTLLAAVNDLSTGPVSTVASAPTTDIGAAKTSRVNISGVATITSFGAVANRIRIVNFTGSPLLTNGAALALPNGANIQASAGDKMLVASDNSGNWTVMNYWPASEPLFGAPQASIAAAGTVNLGAQNAFHISVTGTGAITSLGAQKNAFKLLRFPSAGVVLTHSATLQVPGGANFTSLAGDMALAWSDNSATPIWYVAPLPAGESNYGRQLGTAADATAARALLGITEGGETFDAGAIVSGVLDNARLAAALAAIGPLTPAADRVAYFTSPTAAALATLTAFGRSLMAATDAAAGRTALSAAPAVHTHAQSDISGLVAALAALQPYSSALSALSGSTAAFLSLSDDATVAAMRTTLGLALVASSGSAADLSGILASARLPASLASIYALTPAADKFPYYTSGSAAALGTVTGYSRGLFALADVAAWQTALGIESGVASLTDLVDINLTAPVLKGQSLQSDGLGSWENGIGVVDLATGQRVEIANTSILLGGATIDYLIAKKGGADVLNISGGTTKILGGNLWLCGETDGTPNRGYLRSAGTNMLQWDPTTFLDSLVAHRFFAGTLALPGIAFTADPDSGLRWVSSGKFAITSNGVDKVDVDPAGLNFIDEPRGEGYALNQSGRNYIENPSFDLWQAGPSFALAAATSTYIADRWKAYRALAGGTISKETGFAGAKWALQFQRVAGNTSTSANQIFWQMDPDLVRHFQGKRVVVSLDALAGANYSGGKVTINVYSATADEVFNMATPGFPTGNVSGGSQVDPIPSTTAQRLSSAAFPITIPANALAIAIRIMWAGTGTAGANDWLKITNVKFERGINPSRFEPKPMNEILGECERFYCKSFDLDVAPANSTGAGYERATHADATLVFKTNVTFPRRMRVVPTVIFFNPISATAGQAYNIDQAVASSSVTTVLKTERTMRISATFGAANLSIQDDVAIHWVADARL